MMKHSFLKVLLALIVISQMSQAQQKANIYVDMGTRGNDISKSMYGIFFEEINHAGDGGLYAEMIQNRGFEEHVIPSGTTYRDGKVYAPHSPSYTDLTYKDLSIDWDMEALKWRGWSVTNSGCTLTKDVVTMATPLHENTPNALQLKITNAGTSAKVNVDNTGYWGVAYKKDATYMLRFYLRTSDYTGKVKTILCNASGSSIGEQEFDVKKDGEWTEYTATLTASQTLNNGRFRLQFSGNGTVNVDYVSLFPTDTYKGHENGLRKDIAGILEDLHPAFMRWPGGCIVEGWNLENRVRWKETLGDPMTRRGEYDTWGYRSTYGLGYHEFLQFCEDLGMQGMFVANVGMGCGFRNGDYIAADDAGGLKPYLQDIRDAIDYAIGTDPLNEWVQRRIAAGHPDPLPLKYVELGNENGTERYSQRYAFFYNTLKAEYPQITFINTLSYDERSMIEKTDMFDVHWYVNPDYFYNSATLFEGVPRGDYTVYAGEYAANGDVGSGNMDAALSEGVFCGAMERNGDLVTMASYAPLLTNVNQPNWSCNLIWFDNYRVMGRASYYVQKLYAENRPDYNVKTRMYSDGQTLYTRGRIGLGTWNTQAEFRNIKVTSHDGMKTLYESDFANNLNQWTEDNGTWEVTGSGTYRQSANGTPCVAVMNAYSFCNSTLELEARKTSGAEGFLIYVGTSTQNMKNGWRVNIGGWGNTKTQFERLVGGNGTPTGTSKSMRLVNNKWYKIKIVMNEAQNMQCYIDGELVAEVTMGDIFNGRLQAYGGYDTTAGEMVVKVVNAQEKELTADLTLNGNNIQPVGKVITLASKKLTEENTLDNPTKIAPVESTFNSFGRTFTYTFKPCSFTIFRIKADGTASSALEIPAFEWDDTPQYLEEAEKLLEAKKQELDKLINQAKSLLVEGAKGADNLQSNIAAAEDAQTEGGTTIKAYTAIISNLQTSITTYVNGLMDITNEQTSKIKNANFKTMSNSGWLGSKPALEHNVGEFFNTTFDTYQTLKGLTNGHYLLYVQGFYRNGSQNEAYAAHNSGTEALNALLYANMATQPIRSLYDFQTGAGYEGQYCDNRAQAEAAFNTGNDTYANYLLVEVTNGQLKLGLKKTKTVASDWICFNNFRLFYVPVFETPQVQAATFCNPLNLPYRYALDASYREAADPTLINFKGEYYLFASKCGCYFHSTDLLNWTPVESNLPIEGYAPTAIEMNGKVYFTHSVGTSKIYVTDDPKSGQWEIVSGGGTHGELADPMLLSNNGKMYIYWGSSGDPNSYLCGQEMSPQTMKPKGKEYQLMKCRKDEFGWEVPGDYNELKNNNPWLEGVWVTPYNNKYYLQYSAPGTEVKAYCNSVYVGDTPLGPFEIQRHNPFCYRPEGFIASAGHGSTFQDNYGNWWHITTGTISRRHMFERRLVLYPVFFDADGEMWAYTGFGDWPMQMPTRKINGPEDLATGWQLLSYKKFCKASTVLTGQPTSSATNEDIRTWWSAKSGDAGEWLRVDLKQSCEVHAVQVNFADNGSTLTGPQTDTYRYRIEVSDDDATWTCVSDMSTTAVNAPHNYIEFPEAVQARYVRIYNVHTPSGQFSLSGLRVFGLNPSVQPPAEAKLKSVVRNANDFRTVDLTWSAASGATGYNIRYGYAPDKLYLNYEVLGGTTRKLTINSLNVHEDYYFTIDTWNEAGITPGTTILSTTGEEITDISTLNFEQPQGDSSSDIYDLCGRKIANGRLSSCQSPWGIYIINGRKYFIK